MQLASPLTIDDFERLPDELALNHELVDGELVDVSGNTGNHNALRDLLIAMLLFYVNEHKLGRVLSEQEYKFDSNAHGPDVSLFGPEKMALYNGRLRVQRFVPDLVIEIVSQNDPFARLVQKVERYRKCGTREAWILDIDSRKAFIFSEGRHAILGEDEKVRIQLDPWFFHPHRRPIRPAMMLTQQQEFDALVEHAKLAGQARDWQGARQAWVKALELAPPDSEQYRLTKARIENIDLQLSDKTGWEKRFAKLGSVGTFLLVALSKGKLLLLGLTKLSTFASMLAFFAVYWSLFGWRFALGFVMSIYIHEMGHVMALRKYNIAASAPMFIPFFGAFVRMKQYPGNVGEDARVGLAGPIWGLGSAVVAWIAAITTGLPVWYAIAHTAAWLNLFNLLPIWQLDGGRGFRALTRKQRLMAAGVAVGMWAFTHQTILLLIALGAGYRLFSRDYPAEGDNAVLTQYAGLIVLLSLLMTMTDRVLSGSY